mmetsp:Transcript_52540/g.105461  ORF Transcript_52540/g.105461 Transcript_52540/m.105461 type:complete len:271 (+) Transcript_52540:710-1522(+)
MPKPSMPSCSSPRQGAEDREAPTPKDSTIGTVAGPVVMAPQSQEMPTMLGSVSDRQQSAVRNRSGTTMLKMRGFMPQRYCKRANPSADAPPTPEATAVSNWKDLFGASSQSSKASLALAASATPRRRCNKSPTSWRLLMPGSLKVTRMPKRRLAKKTNGPDAFRGKLTPMDSPNGMRPLTRPYLNSERPTTTQKSPTAMSQVRIHCSSKVPMYRTINPVSGTTARLNSRTKEAASKSSARAESELLPSACDVRRDEEVLWPYSSSEANSQ